MSEIVVFHHAQRLTGIRAFADRLPEARHTVRYTGDQHLFADPSLPSYDEDAAQRLIQRVLAFLAG